MVALPRRRSFSGVELKASDMRTPNFFLVGAPRCGTTAIYRWLREHPQVYLPGVKECHYFATDFGSFRSVQSHQQYLRLFETASTKHTAVGEASVLYLVSEVAIDNILRFNSQAKIVVAVRNPIDLVHSWHEQLLVTMQEDEPDFDLAWVKQDERAKGRLIPATCKIPQALQYASIGRLATQVQRLLERIDRDQIHFIVYDDLAEQPSATCAKLLAAIGVTSSCLAQIERVNQNTAIRSMFLQKHWQHNGTVVALRRWTRAWLGDTRAWWLRDAIMPRLAVCRARPPLSPVSRQMLVEAFRPEIDQLSDLLRRDLRHWLAA